MTEVVLDSSVVVKWFGGPGKEANLKQARRLRNEYMAGRLVIVAPSLLPLELLNVAGRSWRWDEEKLLDMADLLGGLAFELRDPGLDFVCAWIAHGLTAYDASFVALADQRACSLITDDEEILRVAPEVATPLKKA